ncbi:alpha/beta-Hydrolases superfamily protein [Striga asiatica]|uniref:Alpha/beta-Hydrolases superfamily protein n=1 Tax=Striga asiatica TaxID=4170 RepID=A0A5A7NXI8_STRAF|nr:alpha/beta-Hydrolases superfamily protein [Striga asiatica]
MASEREIFSISGPTFLTAIDCLVQGAYTLERDRRQNRQGPHALAPPWWQFFNFRLVQVLVDDHDVSIFGAVYEFNFQYPYHNYYLGHRPPQYVIAFRGTINKAGNREQDFKLNFHCIFNNLHNSTRFQISYKSVSEVVQRVGPGNIWVAGHSLGSSIALVIGREMVKTGIHLETYLFNPPFVSPPIGRITNEKLKLGLRLASSVLTVGLVAAVKSQEKDLFTLLSTWIPYLFINPEDPICSEYLGYFQHREDMESIGAGKIGRLATKHSIGSIFKGKDGEAVHLLPCAYLSVNLCTYESFKEAHGIHQWWRPDLELKYKLHQYK